MLDSLVMLLIWLITVIVVAAILLWAVGRFLPELAQPARYIVGAVVLIVILLALLRLVQGGALSMP